MTTTVSFLRHAGWFSPEMCSDTVNIIGCGATGSHIALAAAKMGFHYFRLFDADIVENHNLPNQVYDCEHVGIRKVEALAQVLKRFNPEISVEIHPYFFKGEHATLLDGPVVLTVDTMSARKEILYCCRANARVKGVVETRLGYVEEQWYGEVNLIDNFSLEEIDSVIDNLVSDDEVPEGPCNLRICTTLVGIVSSCAVHSLCAMYVAQAKNLNWDRKKKTMISLGPNLTTFVM